jgi:hypothetical protein
MTACTVLTDVDSLRSRPDASMSEAGGSDAAVDGTTDIPDSASDTPLMTDSGGKRFCETVSPMPTFCEDFDVGAFGAAWGTPNVNGTGTALGPFSMITHSSPNALQAMIGGPSTNTMEANLPKLFGGTFSVLDYSFWLYLVKKPTVSQMEFADVGVNVGQDSYYVGIVVGANDYAFAEHDSASPTQYMSYSVSGLVTGKWMHVEWHLNLNAPASVVLKVDGATAWSGMLPAFGFTKGAPWIGAGINYASKDVNGGELLIDDLTLTMTP